MIFLTYKNILRFELLKSIFFSESYKNLHFRHGWSFGRSPFPSGEVLDPDLQCPAPHNDRQVWKWSSLPHLLVKKIFQRFQIFSSLSSDRIWIWPKRISSSTRIVQRNRRWRETRWLNCRRKTWGKTPSNSFILFRWFV